MSRCIECGSFTKDGLPICVRCLKTKWECLNGFIKPKHDPTKLPWALPKFRSVVTADFITDKQLFIQEIAEQGQYYWDNSHNNYCCVLNRAIGNVSGSAIPAYFPMPTYPLDSLFVADAIGNPHVFAEDFLEISTKLSSGILVNIP